MRNNRNKLREQHSRRSPQNRPVPAADSFLDEMKNDIVAFFEINSKDSFSQTDVLENFDVTDRKTKLLTHGLLGELVDESQLTRHPDGTYQFNENDRTIEGTVDHVNPRFAFVGNGDRDTDIYVSTEDLNGAIDGDKVKVTRLSGSSNSGGFSRGSQNRSRRIEGKVVGIVERGRSEIVGRISTWPNYGQVVPDSKKIYEEIYIPKDKLGAAKDGDKVIVKLTRFPDGRQRPEGEVTAVLGQAGQNNTEMHAILAEFGLPVHFPDAVEQQSEAISEKIPEQEISKRRDMRGITTFTIDPDDAKDFDDALSIRHLDNGNYEIGVHIADVTHYIQPGTPLEDEAFKRGTSVYLVDRVVPMLPEKLSNNLCSLRPNEDKLTFSTVFEITPDAKIKKEWFGRTVIHSDRRFAYEEAQDIVDRGQGDYLEELRLLNELAFKFRDERFRHGAINFETVEVKFKLDENGVPLSVYPKIRKDAHKLIEEFMLLANKRVAEFVHGLSRGEHPNVMVYRVHDSPDFEKLKTFATFAGRFGYKLKIDSEKELSKSFNTMMESLEGQPEQNALQQLAIRTMAKARYSTEDIGHFGLSFRRYSHFTSPIRRYPDMMAHRLLQHYLDGGKSVDKEEYEAKCKHSSDRERVAVEAERASIKYKQVEFMNRMDQDQEFNGIITGVTDFGLFVEITETSAEGLVRMTDLGDDFYEFDKDNYRLIGKRNKRIFAFGDAVTVRVKEANLARRSLDLWLVEDKGAVKLSLKNRLTRRENNDGESRAARRSGSAGSQREKAAKTAKSGKERRKR
ncbi:ribonuclease R [Larkinella rosea]|uniref:Ribonuclease R n=1 Tax=Larkinella rosea TaxID=2025312 RepID=A0A3P1BRQ0_9BACT|nr:ribonuclease R [Larkinella rosea]RRB03777.1 ribonuclease R [Larkinella rosea]